MQLPHILLIRNNHGNNIELKNKGRIRLFKKLTFQKENQNNNNNKIIINKNLLFKIIRTKTLMLTKIWKKKKMSYRKNQKKIKKKN